MCSFLANGFAATSTDAIATEAGVSKQTLYVYYRTKEDLFLDVLEDIVGQLPDVQSMIAAGGPVDSSAALRSCLMALARELLPHWMQPDYVAFMRLVFAEIPRMPQLSELWQQAIPAQVLGTTTTLLETARVNGIAHFANTNTVVRLFIGCLSPSSCSTGSAPPGHRESLVTASSSRSSTFSWKRSQSDKGGTA